MVNYYVIYFRMPEISYCSFLDEPLHRVIDDLKALTTSILDSDSDDEQDHEDDNDEGEPR